jgi:hypothetical protein
MNRRCSQMNPDLKSQIRDLRFEIFEMSNFKSEILSAFICVHLWFQPLRTLRLCGESFCEIACS